MELLIAATWVEAAAAAVHPSATQVLILDWMEFWRGHLTYSPLLLIR